MKKRFLASALVLVMVLAVFCVNVSAGSAGETNTPEDTEIVREPVEARAQRTLEFIFTPPYAGSQQRSTTTMTPTSSPWVRVDYFLDGNGDGTTNTTYYQDTSFALQQAKSGGTYATATGIVKSGTTTGSTKYFTYYSGCGSDGNDAIIGFPTSTSFSVSYGINGYWQA